LDATGLELIAQRVRDGVFSEAVTGTLFFRGEATLDVAPAAVHDVLAYLRDADQEPWPLLMSLHGCDYLPEEPRLAVHYQLLSMERADRLNVRTRLALGGVSPDGHTPQGDDPRLPSVVDLYATADFQEREVYDMFGVVFEGHPDLRRILMPEDYEGFPQRRDFPMGGEPVMFTFNEGKYPRWYD
jgi:NADH-quinone oxidoreductase subunit C